jgi:hypothetical protein
MQYWHSLARTDAATLRRPCLAYMLPAAAGGWGGGGRTAAMTPAARGGCTATQSCGPPCCLQEPLSELSFCIYGASCHTLPLRPVTSALSVHALPGMCCRRPAASATVLASSRPSPLFPRRDPCTPAAARVTPLAVLQRAVRAAFEPREYPATLREMVLRSPDEAAPQLYTDPGFFKWVALFA